MVVRARRFRAADIPILRSRNAVGDDVYDEKAFRYFLGLERRRSERSHRSFLLMVIEWTGTGTARLNPRVAAKLFALLGVCLRETDYVGWYQHGRVVGAVLTQLGDSTGADVSALVKQRVARAIERRFYAGTASRLQVHVYELPRLGDA
jgi:hypothetical protein